MSASTASGLQMAAVRPCVSSPRRVFGATAAFCIAGFSRASWAKLTSACHISSVQSFQRNLSSASSLKSNKGVIKAMAESSNNSAGGLPINLKGKRAFIAGVADDNGYGWAIAKSLAAAGAEILVGTWVPALNIFETSLRRGKFDESRVLPDGSLMEITKVYPLDAVFDSPEDVPEDVMMDHQSLLSCQSNKRYAGSSNWTVKEVVETVKQDFGSIDILVHSLANGPEVTKPLLETSRNGYLAAISASSYSYVSLLKHFLPIMNPGIIVVVMAFEAGRKRRIRVNTISAGPLRSRAAKAIGFIDMMIEYSIANAPLQKELSAEEVGNTAAFLASPLASAITGAVVYVDNGLNAMGVGVDSPIFANLDIPKDQH
uniref:Uncharacterized protein n=1 Tax=Chenopodium quinoa TaxID=63459 RepID=A0A803N825_CHEQI